MAGRAASPCSWDGVVLAFEDGTLGRATHDQKVYARASTASRRHGSPPPNTVTVRERLPRVPHETHHREVPFDGGQAGYAEESLADTSSAGILGLSRHATIEKTTKIVMDPPDFDPILRAIEGLQVNEKHLEVLQAISAVQTMRDDVRNVGTEVHLEVSELRKEIQHHRKETQQESEHLKSQLAKLELDTIALLEEQRKESRRHTENLCLHLEQLASDRNSVLDAVSRLNMPRLDLGPVLDAVRDLEVLVLKSRAVEDLSVKISVLQEDIKQLRPPEPDLSPILAAIHRIRLPELDIMPVLDAIYRIKVPEPDLKPLIAAINEIQNPPEVDFSPVIQAIKRSAPPRVDLAPVLEAVQVVEAGQKYVVDAVREIRVPEPDLSPLRLLVGHLETGIKRILEEVRALEPQADPEVATLREAVLGMQRIDLSPVLAEVRHLRTADIAPLLDVIRRNHVPNTEVLAAIGSLERGLSAAADSMRAAPQVDMRPVLAAVSKMQPPDFGPLVENMRIMEAQLQSLQNTAAHQQALDLNPVLRSIDTLYQALSNISVTVDLSDLRQELHFIKEREPDLTPIIAAVRSTVVDLNPVRAQLEILSARTSDLESRCVELLTVCSSLRQTHEQIVVPVEVRSQAAPIQTLTASSPPMPPPALETPMATVVIQGPGGQARPPSPPQAAMQRQPQEICLGPIGTLPRYQTTTRPPHLQAVGPNSYVHSPRGGGNRGV